MASVLTERELTDRISMMRSGERTVYYRGHLSTDAFVNKDVARLRDIAQRLSTMMIYGPDGSLFRGMGMVELSQRRVGEEFHYIATRVTI